VLVGLRGCRGEFATDPVASFRLEADMKSIHSGSLEEVSRRLWAKRMTTGFSRYGRLGEVSTNPFWLLLKENQRRKEVAEMTHLYAPGAADAV